MKTFDHPLLRIAVAAALATLITGLGGTLFGPVSDARARQLAKVMSTSVQRGADATTSSIVGSQPREAPARPSGAAG